MNLRKNAATCLRQEQNSGPFILPKAVLTQSGHFVCPCVKYDVRIERTKELFYWKLRASQLYVYLQEKCFSLHLHAHTNTHTRAITQHYPSGRTPRLHAHAITHTMYLNA